jgi:GAF domain-containing protein
VLSPVTWDVARSATGARAAILTAFSLVCTALAFVIPQVRQVAANRAEVSAEEREIEARVETRVAVNDALDPVVHLLGNLSREPVGPQRHQMRAQAIPLVLATAAELIGPERSRACWFPLRPGPPARLEPADFAGRAGAPSRVLTEGTVVGDAAIRLVLTGGDFLCEDVTTDPPPGWDHDKELEGRTFIAVSVTAGDTAFGMLTLDAGEPRSLSVDDVGLLRLMAGLLAVALGMP